MEEMFAVMEDSITKALLSVFSGQGMTDDEIRAKAKQCIEMAKAEHEDKLAEALI